MSESSVPESQYYIQSLENSNKFSEKAIRAAIKSLGLFDGCAVLDVPCGIGTHALWMIEENETIEVTGVDFSEDHLDYAGTLHKEKGSPSGVSFTKGDINNLDFGDSTFDFVWCCDGIWPGPKEIGCLCDQPYDILADMVRIVKKGGKIAVLFWSAQKLLPGYPLVEAALNNSLSANIPVTTESDPDLHFMRTPLWLKKTGLTDIETKTFAADICGPLSEQEKAGILMMYRMFWGRAEKEVSPGAWRQYKKISDPDSPEYILNREDYSGFLTYTIFTGTVVK